MIGMSTWLPHNNMSFHVIHVHTLLGFAVQPEPRPQLNRSSLSRSYHQCQQNPCLPRTRGCSHSNRGWCYRWPSQAAPRVIWSSQRQVHTATATSRPSRNNPWEHWGAGLPQSICFSLMFDMQLYTALLSKITQNNVIIIVYSANETPMS